MSCKRILTVQDISCVGQCSLTVALPILTACGIETAVLPTAVLSTHSGGFKNYTFRDLTEDIPSIQKHWNTYSIAFDAIYTGYLGNRKQIQYLLDLIATCTAPNGALIVDPVMADHGKLYAGFDEDYVYALAELCSKADYLLPNLTEACLLTGHPYQETYDQSYIDALLTKLRARFSATIILTGVSFTQEQTGVMVSTPEESFYYSHTRMPQNCHGTGDIFASVFTGGLMRGFTVYQAVKTAADFVTECIRETLKNPNHRYGTQFEPVLGQLIVALAEYSQV